MAHNSVTRWKKSKKRDFNMKEWYVCEIYNYFHPIIGSKQI